MLIYTDGATDVRQGATTLGPDGLTRLLEPLRGLPSPQSTDRLEHSILDWADGPIRDDLCLLVLKPRGMGT